MNDTEWTPPIPPWLRKDVPAKNGPRPPFNIDWDTAPRETLVKIAMLANRLNPVGEWIPALKDIYVIVDLEVAGDLIDALQSAWEAAPGVDEETEA